MKFFIILAYNSEILSKFAKRIIYLLNVVSTKKLIYQTKQDCIYKTFRVLKANEIRQYEEYRTKRLVLEAWNKLGYNN